MAKTVNELTLKLNADMAELKKDLAAAKKHLSGFQKGVSDIGASIKGAFAIGAIAAVANELFQFGKEVSALGGALAGTKMNFDKLNQPGLLDELRAATGGTVTDLELMKATLEADDMGVPVQKLAGFFAYARNEVQETGGSVTELVGTLITGLGKNAAKSLAQLGISTATYKEELAKTGDMMTAVSNIINQKLKDSGKYVETASDITARWTTRWENLKGEIGLLINNAIVKIGPILEDIGNWFLKVWRVSSQWVTDTYNGFVDLYNNSVIFRTIVETIAFSFKTAWNVIKLVFNLIVDSLKGVGGQLAYVFNPKNWNANFSSGLKQMMKENSDETLKDITDFGKEVGGDFVSGFKNIFIPGMRKTSSEIPEIIKKEETPVKEAGKGVGKELARGISEGMATIDVKPLAMLENMSMGGNIDISKITAMTGQVKLSMEDMGKSVVEMTELVQASVTDAFVSIGENLGEALSGGGLSGIFAGFMNVITSFMATFGKVLIAIGVAKLALEKVFVNPIAAIAVGVVLIALSKVASNMMAQQKFANGGIVGGYSFSGDRVPILANSGEMVLNSGQQASLFKQLNGGGSSGGGSLVARVSGNDLLFVLEQSQNKRGYTY